MKKSKKKNKKKYMKLKSMKKSLILQKKFIKNKKTIIKDRNNLTIDSNNNDITTNELQEIFYYLIEEKFEILDKAQSVYSVNNKPKIIQHVPKNKIETEFTNQLSMKMLIFKKEFHPFITTVKDEHLEKKIYDYKESNNYLSNKSNDI